MGFPDSSVDKEFACNAGDPSSIPRSGRSAGEGIGYPLQYSWASLWLSWERIHLHCGRPGFDPWVGKIPWRRERLPTPVDPSVHIKGWEVISVPAPSGLSVALCISASSCFVSI